MVMIWSSLFDTAILLAPPAELEIAPHTHRVLRSTFIVAPPAFSSFSECHRWHCWM